MYIIYISILCNRMAIGIACYMYIAVGKLLHVPMNEGGHRVG